MTAQRTIAAIAFCLAFLVFNSAASVAAPGRARNTIALVVPKRVAQHKEYDISITGLALHKSKAYLFVDYGRCAATYAAEKRIAVDESPPPYTVSGPFSETSGWKTRLIEPGPAEQSDHACTYLVDPRTGRVLAAAKATFVVH
jgi:uncharacterized iron-regulated membrane protein